MADRAESQEPDRQPRAANAGGHSIVAASVLAAASAVVAAAETTRMQEYLDAASIAAASAWGDVPLDGASLVERARAARATERIDVVAAEHNRLARRSVIAATRAADALARTLAPEELGPSSAMRDAVAEVLLARAELRRSETAMLANAGPAEPS